MTSAKYLFICIVSLSVVLLAGVQLPSLAKEQTSSIQRHKINIGKLRKGIRDQLDKIKTAGSEERSLLDELEHIDRLIDEQHQRIKILLENLRAQEKLLAEKDLELGQAKQAKERVRAHLEKRLRAFYLMGKTGFLNVSFSSKTLPELMHFNDCFRELLTYDQDIIAEYRKNVANLQRARDAQALEKSILQGFINQHETEKEKLLAIHEEKKELLERIKTKKGLFEQVLGELQTAEKDLSKTLAALKKQEENKARGFELKKGRLILPTQGKIIGRFGETTGELNGKKQKANGITIATEPGAAVYAVYGGTVLYTGYMRGYGKMVIIDHGLGYYTVTSRFDTITKQKNDRVKAGDLIGTTGEIATLFKKGLYFEIRYGDKPLNPEKWVQKKYLRAGK